MPGARCGPPCPARPGVATSCLHNHTPAPHMGARNRPDASQLSDATNFRPGSQRVRDSAHELHAKHASSRS